MESGWFRRNQRPRIRSQEPCPVNAGFLSRNVDRQLSASIVCSLTSVLASPSRLSPRGYRSQLAPVRHPGANCMRACQGGIRVTGTSLARTSYELLPVDRNPLRSAIQRKRASTGWPASAHASPGRCDAPEISDSVGIARSLQRERGALRVHAPDDPAAARHFERPL